MHLSVRAYREEFKVYNITDAFLLLVLCGVFIMAIARDEAGIKASYSRKFSYLVLVVIGTFLIIFFLVITIWWLIVKIQLKTWCISKFRSFRAPPEIEDRQCYSTPVGESIGLLVSKYPTDFCPKKGCQVWLSCLCCHSRAMIVYSKTDYI